MNALTAFTENDLQALETALCSVPQADCPVTHHFGPGVYIREVHLPAGAAVIGHAHRHEHLCVMLKGRLTLIGMDGGNREISAPATFMSRAGRKVAVIHEDVIFQNVYATEETDIETLESQLFDKSAAFVEATKLLIAADHTEDQEDYLAAIAEHGFTHEAVRAIVENEADQVPFRHGGYKVMVATSFIDGKGLFATGNFAPGDVIAPARVDGRRTPAGRFINHSKTPNAEMLPLPNGDIECVAMRAIAGCRGGNIGEEITVDYRQALRMNT